MLRKPVFAVVLVSAYLVLYYMLFLAGMANTVAIMFFLSPPLVIWMVYTILRYGKYTGPELKPEEEWGYEDKPRDQF